ncbi:hypothetical protein PJL18_01673 [Paenarthrobacter nicotinovorans]|nr:hypothetical protein [Paenarthrobacter nicotinovorans]
MAPSLMLRDVSGTRDSSLTVWATPRPWHSGHAPAAVFGEKASESSWLAPSGYLPAREKSIRSELDSVVSVPTLDRAVAVPLRC